MNFAALNLADLISIISPPMSMVIMLKIFSALVLAETLPKPTEVSEEHVKYRAVMYFSFFPTEDIFMCSLSARSDIHPGGREEKDQLIKNNLGREFVNE